MRAAEHYDGEAGAEYRAWQEPIGEFTARTSADRFQHYLDAGTTVVDFGCGGGELLGVLAAGEKIGIEVNPVARAAAKERGVRTVASADELPDETADVVISHHALEHALDPYRELVQLRRLLKPGGRFVLWLPIDDWRVQRRHDAPDHNHHLYTWSPLLISNLLQEAGFEVDRADVVTHAWPPRVYRSLHRRLPTWAFDRLAWITAVARRHRQLCVVARRPV